MTETYFTVTSGLSGPVACSLNYNVMLLRLPPLAPIHGHNLAHVITQTTPNKNQFFLSL